MKTSVDLTTGPVGRHLVRLAVPMTAGVLAMSVFNLTDSWFVARLGTESLAAMGFTFPVVMLVGSVAMGLGMGVSTCVSRAVGEGDGHRVRRLTTDSILLAMSIVAVLAAVGLATIDPVFRRLGAPEELLPLIRSYMVPWYAAVAVVVLPMVGNNALRAIGDAVTPSVIMIIAAALNVVLDPILIFGLLGAPRLGLQGAALATVAARALSTVAAVAILHYRARMLDFRPAPFREVLASWRSVLHVGIPAALTQLLMPLSNSLMTWLVAGYGAAAVAAFGVGGRVQHMAYVVPIACGMGLVPIIGQNSGAGRPDRARRVWGISAVFGIGWGALCFALSIPFAEPAARLFSDDPAVIAPLVIFLRLIFLGSGMQHVAVHTGFALNAVGRPVEAAILNAIRLAGLSVPLAFLGARVAGLTGLFAGMAVAVVTAGAIAIPWGMRAFRRDGASGLARTRGAVEEPAGAA